MCALSIACKSFRIKSFFTSDEIIESTIIFFFSEQFRFDFAKRWTSLNLNSCAVPAGEKKQMKFKQLSKSCTMIVVEPFGFLFIAQYSFNILIIHRYHVTISDQQLDIFTFCEAAFFMRIMWYYFFLKPTISSIFVRDTIYITFAPEKRRIIWYGWFGILNPINQLKRNFLYRYTRRTYTNDGYFFFLFSFVVRI